MAISGGDGSIILTTKVDESGLSDGLKSLRSGVLNFEKALKGVAVAGAGAFVAVGTAAIKTYADFEQLSGGVQKIFNEIDYATIEKDAQEAFKTMQMSANQYLEVMTTVGANFASTLGDAKGYEVAKQGMKAITDFATGTGRSVDELSEKYQMITKSTSSYQSIADQFAGILPATSAEFLKQAQAAGFLSKNYTKLTNVPMAEYQEAVTQMLTKGVDALGLTSNAANEASTTLSGSFSMLQGSWSNLLVAFANPDQDMSAALDDFKNSLSAVADNLLPRIGEVFGSIFGSIPTPILAVASAIGAVVAGITAYNAVMEVKNVLDAIQEAGSIKLALAQIGLNTAMLASPITWVVAGITALVAAFVILWNKSEGFRNFWIGLWEAIKTAVAPVIDRIKEAFSTAWDYIKGVWEQVQPYFSAIWEGIKAVFSVVSSVLGAFFSVAWTAIQNIWNVVVAYFQTVWTGIQAVFSVVATWFQGMFAAAWAAIQAVWNAVTGYFKAIWETIKGIFSVVKAVLSGNWSDAWAAIKGIVGTWSSYFASVWASIKNVFAAVQSWFSNTFSAAVAAIKSVFSSITSFFGTIWQSIKNVFSDAKSKFLSIGSDIVAGIKSGISNAWSNLVSWFRGLFGDLKSIAKRILGIASPSKWFRDYIGKMIPAGMAIGIERASGLVTKAITILMEDTRSEAQKVIDGSNEVLLESERLYYAKKEEMEKNKKQKEFEEKLANAKTEEERQKIHNEKMIELQEEADNAYLQQLKDTAEAERKLYEARLKDIENLKKQVVDTYNDMANDALKSIEDLQKSQDSFAEKLFNYGDILTEKEGLGWEKIPYNVLSNQEEQIEFLEKYNDALTAVKSRGNIPQDFFSMLRDMSLEEGLEVATLLLEASDDDFAKFIDDWKRKQQVAKQISKNLYKDEANELSKEVSGKFDEVANSFFGIGNNAANNFEDGFLEQLRVTVSSIRQIISSALSGVGGYLGSYANIEGAVNFPTKIPAMATGGIVPHKTLALIGENGKEAVLPLENNTSWMDVLTNKIATKVGGASSTVILEIDGREFGRAVVEQGNRESRRVGTKLVIA